jgi:hypothetical protein
VPPLAQQPFRRLGERAMAGMGSPDSSLNTLTQGDGAEDVARIVMGIVAGLATDELIEPGSVRPELLGETLALIYAGLVVRAGAD